MSYNKKQMANQGFSISRSLTFSSIVSTKSALLNTLKVKNTSEFDDIVKINSSLYVGSGSSLIESRNIVSSEGFTVGSIPTKDMYNDNYTEEFDPYDYQGDFFPGMADFVESNIVAGDKSSEDRLISSTWDDWGNDIFDDWGYFYLYDVESGKYYFPLINPQNQDDGIITTQTFNAFGSTFTIKHGWSVQGIFKFDISVDNNKAFRFGAYGNMGSDGDEVLQDLTQSYSLNGNTLTLHYHCDAEDGDSNEVLYSYFIPKNISENVSQTYNVYYDDDDYMSMISKEVTNGLLVYFSKRNDVKEWVINDLEISGNVGNVFITGNEYVASNILSKGTNLGKMTLTTSINDNDYTPSASSLINGYFTSANLSDNRSFIIPSASNIIASIPNCNVNTSFHFIINNVQSGNYNRNLTTTDGSVTIDSSCINTSVPQNYIFSYIILITNITPESESALILQNCNTQVFA